MQVNITNAIAAALAMFPQLRNRHIEPGFWVANYLNIAASATDQQQDITFADQATILIVGATRVVTNTAGTTFSTNGPLLAMIRSTSSGQNITDKKAHIETLYGTAQNPCMWPWPLLFEPASTLSTFLDNEDSANAFDVRITYYGARVFKFAPKA